MAFTVDPDRFRFGAEHRGGVAGRRVLITGAGKDGGLGSDDARSGREGRRAQQ